MKLKKDSNIAVHFSIVCCYELSRSFYSKDSSNYVARNFIVYKLEGASLTMLRSEGKRPPIGNVWCALKGITAELL